MYTPADEENMVQYRFKWEFHMYIELLTKKKKFLSSHIFLAVGGIPPESGIYIPSDNNSSNAFKMQ